MRKEPALPDLSRLSSNFDNVTVYRAKEDRRRRTRNPDSDSCARAEQLKKALDDVRLELDMAKADLERKVAAEKVLSDLMFDLSRILRK